MYMAEPAVKVLIEEGFHVPVIPFVEVAGSDGATEFWHKGPIGLNTGTILLLTTTSIVVEDAHCPASGVKV